ncbi:MULTISPECIES: hypothetical protein [Alteribacter]|uniref:Uncharacterized protein n=1 Tax=Alteribacter keqinensis TaxID=2483800 RepID=A0A3M7TXZ2_9BACI|nr:MULTISPECIES: hypothetical protein [Alteribacter]MBM7096317.1 hypothetical protein [Alteribacter salitolerans]RNA70457.1 hypothetical protein EBO34_11205 [Alteribacter keqinensis]
MMVRSIYLYAVMLVTLIMMIGGSVAAIMSLSDYFVPSPYYESYANYISMHEHNVKEGFSEKMSEEELRSKYEMERNDHHEMQKNYALNSFFKSLAWIFIPLPVFLVAISRLRKNKPAS